MEHIRKRLKIVILCSILFISANVLIFSQKVVIVSGTDFVTSMKKNDLIRLYQGESISLGDKQISFLDHERDLQVYKDFIKQYFGMTPEEMQDFWIKMKLKSGKTAPKFLPESFLPKALGSITGSISYFYEGNIPSNLHKVEIID